MYNSEKTQAHSDVSMSFVIACNKDDENDTNNMHRLPACLHATVWGSVGCTPQDTLFILGG